MRRTRSALAAALFTMTAFNGTSAQTPRFGIYSGLAHSTLSGKDAEGAGFRPGFTLATYGVFPINENLSFQPELQFVQKGMGQDTVAFGAPISVRVKINYIEVPLLLRISGDRGVPVAPFLLVGPTLAYRLSCSAKATVATTTMDGDCDGLPSTDYGVAAGAGVDFNALSRDFSVAARLDQGLKKLGKNNEVSNRSINLVFGLRF
jgi:hypothetical protein